MKRFHVHLSVDDLAHNIRFYSALFGVAPSVQKADYAKWMLDDPRVNFAISSRGGTHGLNHLGFQVESEAELADLRSKADAADIAVVEQSGAACCYARSDKHWIQDPQGIAWEAFHTLGDIPVFGADRAGQSAAAGGCCVPDVAVAMPSPNRSKCCS